MLKMSSMLDLSIMEEELSDLSAQDRIAWSLERLPGTHILSSSFGIQSAVMLHMMTRIQPDIPVVLVDTGYLFGETYQYIDDMTERFNINLHVYRPALSSAWQEARYGRRWEQGVDGLTQYNQLNKIEPMQRAVKELGVKTWFSGVRRTQSRSRADMPLVTQQYDSYKIHPIADWNDRTVYKYMKQHDLSYHPLWGQGYVSVGDKHTSRPLEPGMLEEETRFFGLKRECGLHE